MSNTFFQFKKFRIDQDRCAMKVCTDACIFGAYIESEDIKHILDIGTGTGLLSLMMAQRSNAEIDAVEIEINAFEQAKENFYNSPWNERLKIFHSSIQDFPGEKKYDLIICNPPFFTNNLKSSSSIKNIALHSESLSFFELAQSIKKLLKPGGNFYILLPPYEFELFRNEIEKNKIYLVETCTIRDRKNSEVIRIIGKYSDNFSQIIKKEFFIKEDNAEYSNEFRKILADYYLNL